MILDSTSFLLLACAIVAGLVGSLIGLGGGIIVIPALTLLLGIDIKHAIAASLISVLANSAAAAARYVKLQLTNIRLALLLELATSSGAILGALLALRAPAQFLFLLFGGVLIFSASMMWKTSDPSLTEKNTPHPWSTRLSLNTDTYNVAKLPQGLFVMLCAGLISALMGLGGGIFKVLAMDRLMRLPIKTSTSTSNFMLGVTAAAGAATYYLQGFVLPNLAAPVAIGNFFGALIGSHLMTRLPAQVVRRIFVIVLVLIATQMIWKGVMYP